MKLFLKSLFVLFTIVQIQAQEKTISGVVSDENGLPLPSATVLVKGTTKGTQTDFDGNYSITAQEGDILVFAYVGYDSKEVTVGASNKINVSMELDNTLDEVVVTAFSNKSRESYTSSVAKIKSKSYEKRLISSNGNLKNKTFVGVRGVGSISNSTSPLYIVDGKIMKDLISLDALNISSINILKTSTAKSLYGRL